MPDVSHSVSKSLPAPVVTIKLPTAFNALTGGQKQVDVEGDSIREVLSGLERSFPGVLERLMDQKGSVKRYVNVYRNDSDIRGLEGLETKVENQDVIWIVPAVAGGSGTTGAQESR
ncbi:MoaD/ThiS family protein [Streptomyces sp. SL13]|jgi:molybdopterin synthase sulfur carrier subunit|uniref:MoaD/ThiS family protein n=1 Tax=Streptantibioticus silvisoli TaxID=2705255 RepID=A0AA90K7E5_9ACTN|nr:MoaD/ThiS family protein [Streptantibioticus silvisoli]MDI5961325.1 MoaD/ThiS family protein [Streptantibioticus silvisoli]MDI5968833.1 MoaD/ThiS family protein [Streptantibioticus silvisoli]